MDYFDSPECNPRGWSLVKIEELISDLRGGAPLEPEDFVEKGFPVLHKGAIKQAGQIEIDPNKKTFADEGFSRKHKNSIITRNHVAVTLRDLVPSGPAIGMMSYLINAPYSEYILAQGAYGFLVDTERVIPEYLVWLSNSPHYRRIIRKIAVGSTQIHVRTPMFTSLKIPLPPLTEQKRIASLLARADRLRQLRRTAHDLGNALLQSVFLEMFGDPLQNPKNWKRIRLENCCDQVVDCMHTTPNWTNSGVLCVRTSNLTNTGGWDWSDTRYVTEDEYKERTVRSEVNVGDIILSREGTVGVVAIVLPGMKICLGQRLVQVSPKRKVMTSEFMLWLLLYELSPERIEKVMTGSTSQHLNLADLRKMEIIVPPLSLQEEFAGVVARVESLRGRMGESARQVEGLFESLLAEAFEA